MTETQGSTAARPQRSPWWKILGVVLGLLVVVPLMLLAFLAPQLNSGASDLPIGISGPEQLTASLEEQLDTVQPGAFEVTEYASAVDVAQGVLDRDLVGGISVREDGSVTITTAGGAGSSYSTVLQGVGDAIAQTGTTVTYDDVAPLTEEDPTGAGISALAMPLAFGGMISAVLLSNVLKKQPWFRVLGSITASLAVGFAVTAILQFGFGSIDGSYVLTALSLALGTAAISLFILGMESLLGTPGMTVGTVIIMFIANPLSGLVTGWQWLPSPWGLIGQLLPLGATGTLLRSMAFFDGHGAATSILVLSCWVVLGIALAAMSSARARREVTSPAPKRSRREAAVAA